MKKIIILFLGLLMTAQPSLVFAGGLIRDAEIEQTIRSITNPILRVAGISPEAVKIYIIDEDSINAFVAGGSNIFIHTGLLLAAETPEMLAGVIAHEVGHIAGGHLASGTEKLENAQLGTILSVIAGAAIAAAGGGDAAIAAMSAGQHASMRGFLSFTRSNEQFADQAALGYLAKINISANGMLKVFEKLRRKEHDHFDKIDPYAITHPLGKDRISHIRNNILQGDDSASSYPSKIQQKYDRLTAKLEGFLKDESRILQKYSDDDNSEKARYARAISYYRQSQMEKSLKELDSLIADAPNDAFYHEMKGQVLFENGKLEEAEKSYRTALENLPSQPLIQTALAQNLLAEYDKTKDKTKLDEATKLLEEATGEDDSYILSWNLQIKAYGLANKLPYMHLAMAEKHMINGETKDAKKFSQKAKDKLPSNSPAYYRANDLLILSTRELEKEEK